MDAMLKDIGEISSNYIKENFFNFYSNEKSSIKNLEKKLDTFFKKEKRFFKNKLLLYYNFNKSFSDIFSVPYYISLFYSNLNYIVYNVKYAEFDRILKMYKDIVKKNPNYQNSRLKDKKPAYDRRFFLLITYNIFFLGIYLLAHTLYYFISYIFYFMVESLDITEDETSTFILFVLYVYFILGVYYGGIQFLISTIIMVFNITYYVVLVLYYIIYYIVYLFYILFRLIGISASKMVGGKIRGGKMQGGNIFNDLEVFMNNLKKTYDDLSISFVVTMIDSTLNSLLPESDLLHTECKSTSNIELMLSEHNNKRNVDESINITKKLKKNIATLFPKNIRNDKFLQCMFKEKPKKPKKCN